MRSVHIGPVSLFSPDLDPVPDRPTPLPSFLGTLKPFFMIDTCRKLTRKHVSKFPSSHDVQPIVPSDVMKLISDVLPRLKKITRMSVNYYWQTPEPLAGWRICDPKAQYLPLDIDFPNLTELRIRTVILRQFTGIAPPDINALVGFINKFQKTLARLSFAHSIKTAALDLQPMYNSLAHFPNLVSIDLDIGDRGYTHFVTQHAGSLRDLHCPIGSFSEGVGPIEFSKLKKLTLTADTLVRWEPESNWWMNPSPFLKSILPTLRILRINHWSTGDEMSTFLTTAAEISGHCQPPLEELSIYLQTFSISIFPSIASTFPKLRSLEISFLDLLTEGAPWAPIRPDESFPFAEVCTNCRFVSPL